ncbi:MAG: glucose-1-phosphate adenylyltransferase [Anaerolineae bacterium]
MLKAIAVILAGGEGRRLSILSQKRAKPAVPFAGKYRIIDFTLSNCVNSGIYHVGIATQYRPRSLHDHIRVGRPWDLDRARGGVTLLQPFLGRSDSDWYQGTADAIYQNMNFVRRSRPQDVLVLSGDHVYKMNYDNLLKFHREYEADCTVAVRHVPLDEASRFGMMVVDEDHRVIEFEEKPTRPKSTLASMGVYAFTLGALEQALQDDLEDSDSERDFGKNIIPRMLAQGKRIYAYPYSGYWVDVGTVQAYWEAHMELLDDEPTLDLLDRDWIIHTRSEERPPVNIRTGAIVSHSMITDGCIIEGSVEFSVLSSGVHIERGAVVRNSIIMTDTVVQAGAVVDRCIVDKQVTIGRNVHLGWGKDYAINTLGNLATGITLVGKNTQLPRGLRVGRNCVLISDLRESDFTSVTIPSGATVSALTA